MNPHASLLLLTLAACGTGDTADATRATAPLEPTVRDSAGVTIYEHPADALERAPLVTIDSEPLLRLQSTVEGGTDDPSLLRDVALLADGRLVGWDGSTQSVVVVPRAGEPWIRIGKAGAGPDEFSRNGSVVRWVDDTIIVTDFGNARVAVVHPDAGVVRTIPANRGMHGTAFAITGDRVLSALALWRFDESMMRDGNVADVPFGLIRWGVRQEQVDTLMTVPGFMSEFHVEGSGTAMVASTSTLRFDAPPRIAAWAGGVVTTSGEQWRLALRDNTGSLIGQIAIPLTPSPVLPAHIAAEIEDELRQEVERRPEADTAQVRADLAKRGSATLHPAIGNLAITAEGTAWVLDPRLPGRDGWSATHVGPDGRLLGRIVAAEGDPPSAWASDRVVFRTVDDDGLPSYAVHRLAMP